MKYFKVEKRNNDIEKGIITKYNVSFDKEKLQEIRKKIIENCSEVTMIDMKGIYCPNQFDEHIRNLSTSEVGYIDGGECAEILYHMLYDKYEFSKLADDLNDLINGDENALDNILVNNYNEQEFYSDKCQKEKLDCLQELNELMDNDSTKVDYLISKIYNINIKLNSVRKKCNRSLLNDYYSEVISSITLTKEAEMPVYIYRKHEAFIEGTDILKNKIKRLKKD